jgi:hypothetical protein
MIIGLSGYAQTGKDTVANYLVESHGFIKISFADPIREALYRLDPNIRVGEMVGASLANAVDNLGWEELKRLSSDARELLQRLGTEVGREMFGKDFWVEQAMSKAKKHDKVVFADVRFPNELEAILENGGDVWRISKPGVDAVNRHLSETALDGYNFKRTIHNLSSFEELYSIVDYFISH